MPPPAAAHGLGPHVVGQRVVVRRLVAGQSGPSGGPLLTDVLGICTAWGEGRCVLRTEAGEVVEIATAEIVAGKPVPPKPSIRGRVGVREAEGHALPLWPDVERVSLGDWELRSDPAPVGRLLKRANSCLSMGDPGRPFAEAEAAVRAFYAERGREALAQVEVGSPEEQAYAAAGWQVVPGGDAHFLMTSVAHALRLAGSDVGVEVVEDGDRARAVRRVGGAEVGGGEVGSARAGCDGDWLGIHGLVVEPEQRGRGHAGALVAALLEWGAERGARTAWLHVETDNLPALALYAKLGFTPHHTNRYLTAGPPPAG